MVERGRERGKKLVGTDGRWEIRKEFELSCETLTKTCHVFLSFRKLPRNQPEIIISEKISFK
jgi:hypothetical protein